MKFLLRLAVVSASSLVLSVFAQDSVKMPNGSMDLEAARNYMLTLINKDRATEGLKPVVLDDTANAAAQMHSDDMAIIGFHGHWDTKGRKPEQRYTESGGTNYNRENASLRFRGSAPPDLNNPAKLDKSDPQYFTKEFLEDVESRLFNEKPPQDGHRRNILAPSHNKVGIGLTLAESAPAGMRTACVQEFVNDYGKMTEIPKSLKRGESFDVAGQLDRGVTLASIELRWERLPVPMTPAELNKTGGVNLPEDKVLITWPGASEDRIKVTPGADGASFKYSIKSQPAWRPGLYYVFVFGTIPGATTAEILSIRTIVIQ